MKNNITQRLSLLLACLLALPAWAQIELTDIAGRNISLAKPAERIVLGEGRFVAALGVLGLTQPLAKVAGMMNEFPLYDPASYARYRQAYPEIEKIAKFGHTNEASVSIEKLLSLQPDLAIFGLSGHGPGARSKHIIDRFKAAGIPILFIDFRQQPLLNTAPSMSLIAKALGEPEKGQAFAEFYQRELAKVQQGLAGLSDAERPKILFELRAGSGQECCLSVAEGMFAAMAEAAGGRSIATGLLPGPVGQLSREKVLTSNFDLYIGTAIGSPTSPSGKEFLLAGPGVSPAAAATSLQGLMQARGMAELPAIKAGKAYSLWHHFYNSPLNIYAIQAMAKWLHPARFQDLQPEQTLAQLLAKFEPIALQGSYGTAISAVEKAEKQGQ
ncbi:MAG: ABC transporter substrate-binding protein [Cellvibrionaceae bacterium]|nr:ABC transporter substrate-binding protein [Cellvibrionaceae bacterium]